MREIWLLWMAVGFFYTFAAGFVILELFQCCCNWCLFVGFLIQICDNYIAALKTEVLYLWLQQIQERQKDRGLRDACSPGGRSPFEVLGAGGPWEGQISIGFWRRSKRSSSTLYPSQRCLKNMLADTNLHYVTEIWIAVDGHIIPTAFQIAC